MRFLVVNNYSRVGGKGLKLFARFVQILRQAVEGDDNITDLSNDYTLIENPEEIDRFLVDPMLASGQSDAKSFDLVDMVFIVGNSTNLPWSVANSKGEALLDSATGDLYFYNAIKMKWLPKYNIGFHWQRTNSSDPLAQRIVSRPKFQVDEVHRTFEIYKASRMDSICHIKREFVNYYLFQGVENPILVTNNSTWIPHPFVALSESRRFKILAESEDKYQIIELGNSLGLMFEFNNENHNHRWLLRNFVHKTIEKVRSSEYRPKYLMDIMMSDRKNFESVQDETIKTMYEEYVQRLKEEISKSKDLESITRIPQELDVFKHSGMACRKHTLLRTVNQNSINKAEEYPKHDMSGFHDPFLGDTERESRRWNNNNFRQKYARSLLKKHMPGSRNKSTTRAATSTSMSSEKARQKTSQTPRREVSEGNSKNLKDSRSSSHRGYMKYFPARNNQGCGCMNLKTEEPEVPAAAEGGQQAGVVLSRVQSYRESQMVERLYHQRGEEYNNPQKGIIEDMSSFARLRKYASKESIEEDDPSQIAGHSEATFLPHGGNKLNKTQKSFTKGVGGIKVFYKMRPNELNLVLPRVDTGLPSRSVSHERTESVGDGKITVVNNLLMSKNKVKPLNALIRIVQVGDPDDKTKTHLKRRKLRMSTEEERYSRQNVTFKY